MKIKICAKYYLRDIARPVAIFYLTVLAFFVILSVSVYSARAHNPGAQVTFGGLELASAIFLFVAGLNCFKPQFHFFLINGVSRKSQFKGFAYGAFLVCAFMAAFDALLGFCAALFTRYQSMLLQIRIITPLLPAEINGAFLVQSFLFYLFMYLAAMGAGYFLTTLYYRMDTALKLVFSIGVPVSALIVLPYADARMFGGALSSGLSAALNAFFGTGGPLGLYMPVLFFALLSAVFLGLSFLLVRRAVIKE